MEKSAGSSAGHAIVRALEAHGVDRVFEVPGESFLDVLDGLHDAGIQTVVCRQEGGATYAAEADGKLTGRPGVAMVTRGPGAANAMVAVHQAWQDAHAAGAVRRPGPARPPPARGVPGVRHPRLVRHHDQAGVRARRARRASEIVAEAFFAARSGRPGTGGRRPARGRAAPALRRHPVDPLPVADGAVDAAELHELGELLAAARRPLVMTGGNEWSPAGAAAMTAWLERTGIPAITQWRADGVVPSDSPVFAGTLGYRRDYAAAAALDEADLLLAVGTVLGEIDTDGYTLRQRPDARTVIVSIDPARTGHSGPVTRHILARPDVFAAALAALDVTPRPEWSAWRRRLRAAAGTLRRDRRAGRRAAGRAGQHDRACCGNWCPSCPRDAIVTYGAGNHSGWAQRFIPTRSLPGAARPPATARWATASRPPWPPACATRTGSSSRSPVTASS